MPSIGSLAIQLSANPNAMLSGLDVAAKKAQDFGVSVGKWLSLPGTTLQKGLAIPGAAIDGLLKPVHGLLSSIPFIGGALGALPSSVGGFVGFIRQGIDNIVQMTREADKLGLSVASMSGIMLLAGPASEGLERSLFNLSEQLGQAASGSQEAQAKFVRLGLDAKSLASLPLDQALGKIMDRFAEMPTQTEKSAFAFDLFGKRGAELLPILNKGSGAIAEATERAKSLGLSFDRDAAQKALAASKSLKSMELAVKGLGMQIAVQAAPLVEQMTDSVLRFIKEAGGIEAIVKSGSKGVLSAIANILDALQSLNNRLDGLMNKIGPLTTGLQAAFSILTSPAGNSSPDSWSSGIRSVLDQMDKAVPVAGGKSGNADEASALLMGRVHELEAQLRKSIDTFGMSATEIKIWELAQSGASAAALKTTEDLERQMQVLERHKKLEAQASKIRDETQAPLEKFRDALDEITELEEQGLINANEKALAIAKQVDELEKAAKLEQKAPEALEAGTNAAFEAIAKFQREMASGQSPQQRVEDLVKEQTEIQRQQLLAAQQTAQAVSNLNVVQMH